MVTGPGRPPADGLAVPTGLEAVMVMISGGCPSEPGSVMVMTGTDPSVGAAGVPVMVMIAGGCPSEPDSVTVTVMAVTDASVGAAGAAVIVGAGASGL